MKRSMAPKGSAKIQVTFPARACHLEVSGETKKAEETYLEWIETVSGSAEARYEYAAFLTRQDDYEKAKAIAEESVKLDGNSFKSQILLASICEYEGDFVKAIQIYSYAYIYLSEQASDRELGTLLCDRGNLYLALSEIDKSIRDYTEGLKLFPTCYMAQWDLGKILRDTGDFVGAQKRFDLALQSDQLTKKQGTSYLEFLLSPKFQNQYDEMCQVAKFPCHLLCGAVTVDLMFLNWAKLSPGLRNYVRHLCTSVFNNVSQKYRFHIQRYRLAIKANERFPGTVTEVVLSFLMGHPSIFQ